MYYLVGFVLRTVVTPLCILNPFTWLDLPAHLLNIVDDAVAVAICLVSVVVHPAIFALRTLSSMIFGYEEGSDFDYGQDAAEEDLTLAMAIW